MYGCGKKFWHPSRWPWVKVTKLVKRDKIYLVRTIMWEPPMPSLHNLVDISPLSCHPPDWTMEGFWQMFSEFYVKFQNAYSPGEHYVWHTLGMTGPIDVKQKGMSQLDDTLTRVPLTLTFDLEISRSNCISGMGGPIVMERRGRGSIGCRDVKYQGNDSTRRCADCGIFDPDLSPSRSNLSREWEARLSWIERDGVDRMAWCEALGKYVN